MLSMKPACLHSGRPNVICCWFEKATSSGYHPTTTTKRHNLSTQFFKISSEVGSSLTDFGYFLFGSATDLSSHGKNGYLYGHLDHDEEDEQLGGSTINKMDTSGSTTKSMDTWGSTTKRMYALRETSRRKPEFDYEPKQDIDSFSSARNQNSARNQSSDLQFP